MARIALALILVSEAFADITISGSGFSVASESVTFLSAGSCDNDCFDSFGGATCRERIEYLIQQGTPQSDAIQQVYKECSDHGFLCSCGASDFPDPGPPGRCDNNCTDFRDGQAYTCRGRIQYLIQSDAPGTPQSDAIQQVNTECSGQCSCGASDFPDPGPPGPGDYCHAISPSTTDKWCNDHCHFTPPNCPADLCVCGGPAPGPGPSPSPTPPAPWPPTPGPDGPCTALQNASGCAACSNSAQCNTCKDGFVLDKVICSPKACGILGCETCSSDSSNLRGSQCTKCAPNYYGADCTPWYSMKGPEIIQFYNYRASDNESYAFGNCDGASAMGVIAYLHHEVVGVLEHGPDGKMYPTRKFGIDRIKRQLITMMNPPAVYNEHQGQFGPWNPFDKAQCSTTDPDKAADLGCKHRWDTYGYNVGCLKTPFNPSAKTEQYYDFPAECPVEDYTKKTPECKTEYPGGQCLVPDGRRECTWKAEDAGEIMLSDLEGIPETQWKTWDAFRAARVCEFDKDPGNCHLQGLVGTGLPFWNEMFSWIAQQKRAQTLMDQFKAKYPDSAYLNDPYCDH